MQARGGVGRGEEAGGKEIEKKRKSTLITRVLDTGNHRGRQLFPQEAQKRGGRCSEPDPRFHQRQPSSCWCLVPAPAKGADRPSPNLCFDTAASLTLTTGLEQPCSQLDQAIDLPETNPTRERKDRLVFSWSESFRSHFCNKEEGGPELLVVLLARVSWADSKTLAPPGTQPPGSRASSPTPGDPSSHLHVHPSERHWA